MCWFYPKILTGNAVICSNMPLTLDVGMCEISKNILDNYFQRKSTVYSEYEPNL